MMTSLIITTKNEEKSIARLLDSILDQSRLPNEVIIADAGSTDKTKDIIKSYQQDLGIKLLELSNDANRAVGRNKAIDAAKYEHILITDAGCRLHKDWVVHMREELKKADVVAGFYAGEANTTFEKAMIPYVLVMPKNLDPNTFLPATRSMGITKAAFEKTGRFNERYRYAEDYEFARRLKTKKIKIHVAKDALVYWRPRTSLFSFYRMIYEHAFGDGYSKTFRGKVALIFLRYAVWISFLPLLFVASAFRTVYGGTIALYLLYTILKNIRYVPSLKGALYLIVLQLTADSAVMQGTTEGYSKRAEEDSALR